MTRTRKVAVRITSYLMAVVVVSVVVSIVHIPDRPLAAALSLLAIVILASIDGPGIFYTVLLSFAATLGFSWSISPIAQFHLADPRVGIVLAACLVAGVTASFLSDRMRRVLVEADRRQAEVVAGHQRLMALVNSVDGIVWDADPRSFVFSFVSERAEAILGYPAEQWLREPTFWKDHLYPEDRDWAVHFCQERVAEKRSHDFEYRMIAADGRVVWIRDLVTVVAENGVATRLHGVMVDVTSRKENEQLLRKQANLLNLTHDAILVRDMKGTILYWNRGAEELYGWPAEQAIGQVAHELFRTVFPVPLDQIMGELTRTGRWEGELLHTKRDGVTVNVASRWSLQRDDKSTPIAILTTNNDIRERKQAEGKIRQSEAELRQLVDVIPQQVFVFGADWNPLFANRRELEYTGLMVREMQSKDMVAGVFHPEDLKKLELARARASSDGAPFEIEARIRGKDGQFRWFLIQDNPLRDEEGNVLRWYGTRTDIEDRKRAEEALRRSKAYLDDAQRLTRTGSWAYEAGGGRVYWSEENCRIWGFDPAQGAPSLALVRQQIHPEDRDTAMEYAENAVRAKRDFTQEFRIVLPDGAVKHIHAVGHPVANASGEGIEVIGTHIDVTERKRTEQERERLRQLEDELARINRVSMIGELAVALSHELKQPIAAAITNASTCLRWLKRDHPDIQEAREAAERIVQDGNRAAGIIDRLRSLYKTGTPPERERVDLNEVAREMLVLLRSEADRHSIPLHTDLAAGLPRVTADRVQLQQVFLNLMLNGIEAMTTTGGTLLLTSQLDPEGRLLISIADSGVGLPPGIADQIFDAFFTTKPHGSGMGLAISRSIIESHGGRLWASSNPGRGATFHFTLPVTIEDPL